MKKLGVYSLLVAAMLFSTGCSEKNADMNVDNGAQDSVNTNSDTNLSDGGFSALEKAANGNYYMINGQKVLIEHVYFAFDKYNLTSENKDKATSNASKLSIFKCFNTFTNVVASPIPASIIDLGLQILKIISAISLVNIL